MNANDLKKLIVAADRSKLCAAMKPLSEKEREALRSDVIHIFRTVDAAKFLEDSEPIGLEDEPWFDENFVSQLRTKDYADWRIPRWAASLMFLAVTDEKTLRNPFDTVGSWAHSDLRDMPHRVLQVLDDRRPSWLAKFVQRDVKQEFPIIRWSVEFGLMKSGALQTDYSEDFMKRMPDCQVFDLRNDEIKHDNLKKLPDSPEAYFGNEPEFLNTLAWKLFETDTSAFTYNHSYWFKLFATLCEKTKLDRQRLLKASATGMSHPFRPSVVSGFGKLHEQLEPTIDERQSLTDDYLQALGSQHSTVVGTALSALDKLAKAQHLDAATYCDHVTDAFRIPKKAQPVKAIKLLQTLVKQQPDVAGRATEVLVTALDHERADVQEAGVGALEKLSGSLTKKTLGRLAKCAPAASLKARVKKLLDADVASPSPIDKKKSTSKKKTGKKAAEKKTSKPTVPNDLLKRAKKIPAEIQKHTGLDAALANIANGDPQVATIKPATVPRCNPADAVQPIGSVEELIDTVATTIEGVDGIDGAIEIERILDGISRFYPKKPKDFDKRVEPLRKRIEKLSERGNWSVVELGARIGFTQLLRAWLGMSEIHEKRDDWFGMSGLAFRLRARDVWYRMDDEDDAACRLALPTHKRGWIDPAVFVKRIQTDYAKPRKIIDKYDLAQALLRLAPHGRSAALQQLKKRVKDPSDFRYYYGGDAVRYALGDKDTIVARGTIHDQQHSNVASVRARMLVEDEDFEPPIPIAKVSFNADYSVRIDGPTREDLALPVDLILLAMSLNNTGLPIVPGWPMITALTSLQWPADPRPMLMLGWLEHLFDSDFTWTTEAARLAVFAMSAESKDHRLQATDAFITATSEARVPPKFIGKQIAALGERIKLKRVGAALAEAARISTLHNQTVACVGDAAICNFGSVPKDAHHIFTPMLEAMLESGSELTDTAREKLSAIKGSSKGAKLAKQLLAVEADAAKQMTARIEAASAIAERAERWQRIMA